MFIEITSGDYQIRIPMPGNAKVNVVDNIESKSKTNIQNIAGRDVRQYSHEFKARAVEAVKKYGLNRASKDLGVPHSTIANWAAKARRKMTGKFELNVH